MLVPRSPPRPASRLAGAELVTSQRRTRAELQAEFGDRPAGLDRDVARSLLLGFAIFGLVVLLVVGLVVLLIVWLVRRGRSRPAPGPGLGTTTSRPGTVAGARVSPLPHGRPGSPGRRGRA